MPIEQTGRVSVAIAQLAVLRLASIFGSGLSMVKVSTRTSGMPFCQKSSDLSVLPGGLFLDGDRCLWDGSLSHRPGPGIRPALLHRLQMIHPHILTNDR